MCFGRLVPDRTGSLLLVKRLPSDPSSGDRTIGHTTLAKIFLIILIILLKTYFDTCIRNALFRCVKNGFTHYQEMFSLFLWGFSSHSRIFHSFRDVAITAEGLLLTCTRNSWLVSSEGSLTCHTYSDMVHLIIMVISDGGPVTHLSPIAVTTCFNDLGLSRELENFTSLTNSSQFSRMFLMFK